MRPFVYNGEMADSLEWAAGLFEGEGCFSVTKRKSGKLQVQVRLGMTDRDVVERFAAVIGIGRIHHARLKREHEKPMHKWYVQDCKNVAAITRMLLPYLGQRRRAKALEVLAVAENMNPNGHKTHCPQGHLYEGDNVLWGITARGTPSRYCRTCRRAQARERARRRLGITPDRYRIA